MIILSLFGYTLKCEIGYQISIDNAKWLAAGYAG